MKRRERNRKMPANKIGLHLDLDIKNFANIFKSKTTKNKFPTHMTPKDFNFEDLIQFLTSGFMCEYLKIVLCFLKSDQRELCFEHMRPLKKEFLIKIAHNSNNLKSSLLTGLSALIAKNILKVLDENKNNYKWVHSLENGKFKNMLVYRKLDVEFKKENCSDIKSEPAISPASNQEDVSLPSEDSRLVLEKLPKLHINEETPRNENCQPVKTEPLSPHNIYFNPTPGPSGVQQSNEIISVPVKLETDLSYNIYLNPTPGPSGVQQAKQSNEYVSVPVKLETDSSHNIYLNPTPGPSGVQQTKKIKNEPIKQETLDPHNIYLNPTPGPSGVQQTKECKSDPIKQEIKSPHDTYFNPTPGPSGDQKTEQSIEDIRGQQLKPIAFNTANVHVDSTRVVTRKEKKNRGVKPWPRGKTWGCQKGHMVSKLFHDMSIPLVSNVGEKMMRSMGWDGGALGVRGQGITEPIMPPLALRPGAGLGAEHTKPNVPALTLPPGTELGLGLTEPNMPVLILWPIPGLGSGQPKQKVNKDSEFRLYILQKLLNFLQSSLTDCNITFPTALNKKRIRFLTLFFRLLNERKELGLSLPEEVAYGNEAVKLMVLNSQLYINYETNGDRRSLRLKKTKISAMEAAIMTCATKPKEKRIFKPRNTPEAVMADLRTLDGVIDLNDLKNKCNKQKVFHNLAYRIIILIKIKEFLLIEDEEAEYEFNCEFPKKRKQYIHSVIGSLNKRIVISTVSTPELNIYREMLKMVGSYSLTVTLFTKKFSLQKKSHQKRTTSSVVVPSTPNDGIKKEENHFVSLNEDNHDQTITKSIDRMQDHKVKIEINDDAKIFSNIITSDSDRSDDDYNQTKTTLNMSASNDEYPKYIWMLSENYENINLDSVRKIQNLIATSIDEDSFLPLLKCHGIQNGCLIYGCHNEKSYKWLKNLASVASIKTYETDFRENLRGMCMKINSYIEEDLQKVFKRLEMYYPDLDTNSWVVTNVRKREDCIIYTLDFDESNYKFVCENNFSLYAGIDKVEFNVIWE